MLNKFRLCLIVWALLYEFTFGWLIKHSNQSINLSHYNLHQHSTHGGLYRPSYVYFNLLDVSLCDLIWKFYCISAILNSERRSICINWIWVGAGMRFGIKWWKHMWKHILFRILAHSEFVSAQFDIKKRIIFVYCEKTDCEKLWGNDVLLRRLCQSEPMWRKQNLGRRGSRKHTSMLCKDNEMNAIGR